MDKLWQILGRVVTGQKLGRELGFPTLNVDWEGEILGLEQGVYVCFVQKICSSSGQSSSSCPVPSSGQSSSSGSAPSSGQGSTSSPLSTPNEQAKKWPAVCHFGPKLAESAPVLEVHVLAGFAENWYGEKVQVDIVHLLREPERFADLAELKRQLLIDVEAAVKWHSAS